jgi:hypothetical protein
MTAGSIKTRSVELPAELVERVEQRLPRTEWDRPDAYVANVLEEVLFHVESEMQDETFEPMDEAAVQERLQSLGYAEE